MVSACPFQDAEAVALVVSEFALVSVTLREEEGSLATTLAVLKLSLWERLAKPEIGQNANHICRHCDNNIHRNRS